MEGILRRLALLLVLLLAVTSAQAAVVLGEGTTVFVNGTRVLKFTQPRGNLLPNELVVISANRLQEAGLAGLKIVPGKPAFQIVNRKGTVAVATLEEAKAQGTTPETLAKSWVKSLKEAYRTPGLRVPDELPLIAVGKATSVSIKGPLAASATVSSADPDVLAVNRTSWGVLVSGLRPGETTLKVIATGYTKKLQVSVRPLAAQLPQTLVAKVTGKPAQPGTIRTAIDRALKESIERVPESKLKFEIGYIPAVVPGGSAQVNVRVDVRASGTVPVSETIRVNVQNVGLETRADEELWYSNNPERVQGFGPLFAAILEPKKSARLLYHHLNDVRAPIILRTSAINNSEEPVTVHLIPGDSPPLGDPVQAGFRAGEQFLRGIAYESGQVITIPPRSTLPISFRRLKQGQTGSGLCSIRHLEGTQTLLVRTDAFPAFEIEPKWVAALTSNTPWHEVGTPEIRPWDKENYMLSKEVFPNPLRTETVSYRVGARWSVVRIGQKAIGNAAEGSKLDGNFGVSYLVTAIIENPLDTAAKIEIVYEASAGYSAGVFLVDRKPVSYDRIKAKEEKRIAVFTLKAGEKREVRIDTIPLSGSSYPATLTIRPAQR